MSLRDTSDDVLHSMLRCLGNELDTASDEYCRMIYDQRDLIEAELSRRDAERVAVLKIDEGEITEAMRAGGR